MRRPVRPLTAIVLAFLIASCAGGAGRSSRTERPPSPPPTTSQPQPGLQLAKADLGQGRTVRAWLDGSQIHVTFFDPSGSELPVEDLRIRAASDGRSDPLRSIRFGAGHFVIPIDLASGRWLFTIGGSAVQGGPFHARFSFRIS